MVREQENVCIAAVNDLLAENADRNAFSVCGAKESASCMEKVEEQWSVYGYERGAKFQISFFGNIVEACVELIRRVTINHNPERIIEQFYSLIVRQDVA